MYFVNNIVRCLTCLFQWHYWSYDIFSPLCESCWDAIYKFNHPRQPEHMQGQTVCFPSLINWLEVFCFGVTGIVYIIILGVGAICFRVNFAIDKELGCHGNEPRWQPLTTTCGIPWSTAEVFAQTLGRCLWVKANSVSVMVIAVITIIFISNFHRPMRRFHSAPGVQSMMSMLM